MDSANDYILLQLDLLLDELVMQQFVLGVDTHLRVARFVAKNRSRSWIHYFLLFYRVGIIV